MEYHLYIQTPYCVGYKQTESILPSMEDWIETHPYLDSSFSIIPYTSTQKTYTYAFYPTHIPIPVSSYPIWIQQILQWFDYQKEEEWYESNWMDMIPEIDEEGNEIYPSFPYQSYPPTLSIRKKVPILKTCTLESKPFWIQLNTHSTSSLYNDENETMEPIDIPRDPVITNRPVWNQTKDWSKMKISSKDSIT
jgi:hypothetical protein